MKPVNIFVVSFYFDELLEECINKIHKYTKYPHNIIVGDNKSKNSNKIEKCLNKLIKNNVVQKAYLHQTNEPRIVEHMITTEEASIYSAITDGDAFLPEVNFCWLTRFINLMETNKKVGIVGYSCNDSSLFKCNVKYKINPNNIFTFDENKNGILFKGHFMTSYTKLYKDFYIKKPNLPSSDGNIQRYISSRGYIRARFDEESAINGSMRYLNEEYKDIRLNGNWNKNYTQKPIGSFRIISKDNT